MSLQDVFVRNLKYYRNKKRLTQNELTLAIDKGYNYINGIEQKKYFPQPDVIERIAEALDIRPMQLFDENGCVENILSRSRADFVEEITTALHMRLKNDIRYEIEQVLGNW